jgi:hypothetical protein
MPKYCSETLDMSAPQANCSLSRYHVKHVPALPHTHPRQGRQRCRTPARIVFAAAMRVLRQQLHA